MKKKKIFKWFIGILLLAPTTLITTNYIVVNSSKANIFDNIKLIPEQSVGMVLGTAKYLKNARINYYYQKRIEATVALYKAGKIKFVLVSGDNRHKSYNEPKTFKADLIKNGIPADKIFLDYAGFRTLDSVIRAKKVFGQNSIIIISQKFHLERALYLAKKHNLNAFGFTASNYSNNASLYLKTREKLARLKAVFDILFNVGPKFLGEKIIIQ